MLFRNFWSDYRYRIKQNIYFFKFQAHIKNLPKFWYLVQMRENKDQKNSTYEHFSRSVIRQTSWKNK